MTTKSLRWVLSSVLMAVLVFGQALPTASGQGTAQVVPINAMSIAVYDHDGIDVSGQPDTLSHAQVAIFAATAALPLAATTPIISQVRGPLLVGTNRAPISALVAGRAPGTYYLSVLAVDLSGNKSDWAPPIRVVVDSIAPKPPTGVQCISSAE